MQKKITGSIVELNVNHYRRCHVCNSVNSDCLRVIECLDCGKKMAPFYFFDEKKMPVYTDNDFSPEESELYSSVKGLTVYW